MNVADLAVEPASTLLSARHLATLATLRGDGSPHLVPVGFTYDPSSRLARVITSDGTQKVRNVERSGRASVNQIDGPRWLTLEGPARINRNPDAIADAEERYGARYGGPRPNVRRVVIEIHVERVLGRVV